MIDELKRFARFGAVGLLNTLLTLLSFGLLTRAGLPAAAASAVGFAVGAVNGYALNRTWTFRAPGNVRRYVAVQAVGAGCSAAGVALAVVFVRRLEAEALIVPPVTLMTYTLARRLVFQSSRRPRAAPTPARS